MRYRMVNPRAAEGWPTPDRGCRPGCCLWQFVAKDSGDHQPIKDVLVLSYWNLNQAWFGGATRIHALLRMLGESLTLLQPGPAHPHWPSVTYRPDFGRKKLGINWGMFNFVWPTTWWRVRRWIKQHRPTVVVATSIWTYLPLHGLRRCPPVVLDAHDVLGNAIAERYGDRHLFTRCVRAYERRVLARMAHVFVCSDLDRGAFIERYGLAAEKVTTVPNGVDAATWRNVHETLADVDPELDQQLAGRTTLFFMGKLDYQPNGEALAFLLDELMPVLEREAAGQYQLLICGGGSPQRAFGPGVHFTGRVPDIRPYVLRADLCLAPIFSGSGTRLKILEYLAAGKPVIATPKGAEGITGLTSDHIRLADRTAFAMAIMEWAGTATAEQVGQAAREWVAQRYDWQVVAQGWRRVLARYHLYD